MRVARPAGLCSSFTPAASIQGMFKSFTGKPVMSAKPPRLDDAWLLFSNASADLIIEAYIRM